MFTFSQTIINSFVSIIGLLLVLNLSNRGHADVTPSQIKAARQQSEHGADYDETTVLVQFHRGVSDSDRDSVLSGFDGRILRKFSLVPGLVEARVGTSVGDALNVLRASKHVIAAEPNYKFSVTDVPNDPSYSKQWALDSATAVHIDAVRAWALRKGNHSLRIAVLDTGIDSSHPEFADNIWSNPGEIPGDGIDNDANGYIDDTNGWDFTFSLPGLLRLNGDNNPSDGHGHGTHVSGIIAAQGNNAIGVTGICWDAAIVPLKVVGDDGSGFSSWMIAALDYCVKNGIAVANVSIGGASYSGFCKAAIEAAGQQGNLLLVAAAGNNGTDNDITPFYPASYDCPNIVSVASTTSSGAISSFSNRGIATVDIAAPGSSITSTYPAGKSASGYTTLSGTSMAAPMVTSVAALLHENRPEWGFADIKETLLASVTPLTSLSGKVLSGGLVNAYQAMVLANQVELVGLRLKRDVLRGGDVVTAELTLDRVAAAGGVVADVSSSHPAVDLPTSVRIPGGMSTVTVSGLVKAVGATTTGDVTASVLGSTLVVPVTVKPPVLSAARVVLPVIAPGGVTQGVITLQQPAGVSGLDVLLTSDDPGIVLPASVHIDAGQTEAGFDVSVTTGCIPGGHQIKASTDADCVCVDITVLDSVLQNLGFSPAVVVSGQPMSLRVGLSAPAPVGGLVATLKANNSRLLVPGEVTIAAGETFVDIQTVAPSVSGKEAMSVTAGFYGTSGVANVMVVPCMLSAAIPDVSDLASGAVTPVLVRLTGPAGPGGHDVQLSEVTGKLTFPSSVHIVEGQSSAVALVHAANVSVRSSVVLVASDGLTELSVPMSVSPVVVTLLGLSASSITGGKSATGTITLAGPAPGSGADIVISSGNSAVSVPTSVHIPAGAMSASFSLGSSPVREKVIVAITVTAGTLAKSKSITVNPAAVLSVKLQRTSMTGGTSQQAVVLLSGPAPDGGLVVTLSTTNAAVRVPTTLTIPAGAVSGVVSVQSVPVATRVTGLLAAQVGTLKKTSSVSVIPPVISTLVANRGTIVSGDAVDVTVHLTGVAPAGGTSVVLTSASVALSVPASVTVPAGQTSVVITARSHPVAKSVSVKISGKVGVTSKSGYVTVTPR